MLNSGSLFRTGRMPVLVLVLVLVAAILSGCKSKQEQALDQAKKQAATTGQAQQVVSVDKNGTTTTTVVQPPAAGQTNEAITTTVTPPAAGAPVPAPSGPTVSAVPQPPPVPASVSIPAGTTLTIRIDQHISAKTSHAGDTFTGEMVDSVLASDNSVLVPKGAPVGGVVDASHRRGHFKGRSLLELRLTSLTLNGTQYPLTTRDLARSKKGKGRRSTALIGGGSGLGMLVGGVATGGVGLVVGGLVGGGAGTAAAGLTGNRDIEIPAESIVRFKLADDLVVQPAQ
jgi:type II secretory pathway pseudopilin PulG